jgi:WD40 repeat protein
MYFKALTFHPSGSIIAAGTENGRVLLLDENLATVQMLSLKEAKVDDVKFSPDGSLLAASSHSGTIEIFQKKDDAWTNIGTCKGHSSAVTHIDWSEDGKVLQSDSESYEHLFWDMEDISQITKTTAVRNIKWATWTCILGWSVKGIWPKGADGTDVNATCRSHNSRLVATADDFGEVKIFKYPCIDQSQKFRAYVGHSAHVSNVRFTASDLHLISIGGNDRTIFQWKVVEGSADDAAIEIDDEVNKKAAPGSKDASKKATTQHATPTKAKPDTKATPTKPGKGKVKFSNIK